MQYVAKKPLALRVDEELLARIDRERGLVSRTAWIVRALEEALDGPAVARPVTEGASRGGGAEKAPSSPSVVPASPRASSGPTQREIMLERQRRVNEGRS